MTTGESKLKKKRRR